MAHPEVQGQQCLLMRIKPAIWLSTKAIQAKYREQNKAQTFHVLS
jgi:hypothetical protein